MKDFWNTRYKSEEYAYGTEPNVFFKETLRALPHKGHLLLPCEGEGRNAVYAAKLGWEVTAFDQSEAGKDKAMSLAKSEQVTFDYQICGVEDFEFGTERFDAVAIIYAHFNPSMRIQFHQKVEQSLKKGGLVILEVFNPKQLNNNSGGPKSEDELYTKAILTSDFKDMEIRYLDETTTTLSEGKFHEGHADVIRLIACKV